MFPHHENEIAQSEACSGQHFVKYWMHSEHLIVNNKKMSKSLGNFFTLRDLLNKGFSGQLIRYMLIHTHYKTQLNFTFEGLEAMKHSLQRINDFIQRLGEIEQTSSSGLVAPIIEKTLLDFANALADDLNISVALAVLFDFIREINHICDNKLVGQTEAQDVLNLMQRMNQVLGFISFKQSADEISKELLEALEKRLEARKNKDWALADKLRDFIHDSGYEIEDTASGARLKKK
jgi:cysteinyl-tRNA synthetase